MPNPTATKEAEITISGVALTEAQSMTVRVALGSFVMELSAPDSLGTDDTGRKIAAGYAARLQELHALLRLTCR